MATAMKNLATEHMISNEQRNPNNYWIFKFHLDEVSVDVNCSKDQHDLS